MIKSRFALASVLMATLAAPAFAEGDVAAGEKVFKKCKACHMVGDGAKNRTGPMLNGIVGATAAQNPDFKYSSAMQAKGEEGLVWDEEALTAFLAGPKAYLKGTKMAFAGLKKDDDIANIIAYLASFE